MVNWNVLNKHSVRVMVDKSQQGYKMQQFESNGNQIGSNFEGSKRFTVSTTSDPLRAKTSYGGRSAHFVGSSHNLHTRYGLAVEPVVSASTSSLETTQTSESLYLNQESGFPGRCLE